MPEILEYMERLYGISHAPLALLDGKGALLGIYPKAAGGITSSQTNAGLIDIFRQCGQDERHPMIHFFEPGFLLGVVELNPGFYVAIGPVSPYAHTRSEMLKTISESIHPERLGAYCDLLLQQPLMTLEQLKDMICLLTRLSGMNVPVENILFVDNTSSIKPGQAALDSMLFAGREEAESHVPVDFETAICSAIERGNRAMLERALFEPYPGRVGRMSSSELRQQKYAFICLATLVSRAAIRGGMPAETAFSLSDLYCQRVDLLMDVSPIQNLVFTMLMDYCGKVREIQRQPATSLMIGRCLSYISVHLHETITLVQLSRHVGLCSRSLSLKFRAEMGMGIPEYIHREKIKEAEYLLKHTDYSLSEITTYLNYPSQSYFTKVFRQYRQCTPQQFREMCR